MNFDITWRKSAIAAVLGLLAATQASADALVAIGRAGNFTFSSASGQVAVPIGAGVFQTPAFFNAAGQRFIVSYTAECAVAAAAGVTSTWLDLDVRAVNIGTGQVFVLTPTGGSLDALCTSNGTAGNDGWQMNAVNAIGGPGMPAGNYVVQVRARLSGVGTGHLGDSSLVVWR
jgi:hypothetical protein